MSLLQRDILYEDNHLLVVNKPNGALSQGDNTRDKTVIDYGKAYIKHKYDKPGKVFLHPVSRLDRPVSGAIILARTTKALSRMTILVKDRKIDKRYTAIVSGIPQQESATLTHYLQKQVPHNTVKVVNKGSSKAKEAVLEYTLASTVQQYAVLDIKLQTGRPHQIRVQLSHIGHPIVGDGKYGFRSKNDFPNIFLHCRSLAFIHPVKKELVNIIAPYPSGELWDQV